MEENTSFYILFEEADDGYYGDILINRKLYDKTEVDAYIKENATEIYPEEDSEKNGIDCYFRAPSKNDYGTGMFYFQKFSLLNQ